MKDYGQPTWVRLPATLRRKILQQAKASQRKISAQIVLLLQKAIADTEKENASTADSSAASRSN